MSSNPIISNSLFTITPHDASKLVKSVNHKEDNRKCYMLQVSFYPVYSDVDIPNSAYKKLPRLVNGIPLGAGYMSREETRSIRWKYIEGSKKNHTFISVPLSLDDAEETKRSLKDSLIVYARNVFGDITVKATVILSMCLNYDDDFIVNDIAESVQEGLHFRD